MLGRIGRRLLIWFLVVALIPLLFMGYQGYASARRAVEREVFLHMEAVAKSKQLAIEQWFDERESDVRELASTPQLVGALKSPRQGAIQSGLMEDVLVSYQRQSRSFVDLCLHDANGDPVVCTMSENKFMPGLVTSGLISSALKSPDAIMSPIYLRGEQGPSMHIACAVRDSSGPALGVVVATLSLAQTLNPIILDATGLGTTGQAYLVDTAKVMLTPSRFMNHPAPLTHKMDSEGIRAALKEQGTRNREQSAAVYKGFEGQQVLGAWAWLPEQRWALIAEMDASEAFAPLRLILRNTILLAVATLAAVLVIVVLISRSISQPIRRLAEASAAIGRGDLERKVPVEMQDEVGELATRFNQMISSLRESQRQLVQSERLAAIGEIAASVVHEIRNPLSSVKMNLQILEAKSAPDEITREQFAIARGQAERLEKMLNELLDYAKPVALERKLVAADDLLNGAISEIRAQAGSAGAHVVLQHPERGLRLYADAEKLHQVLLNLLLNAVQSVRQNGHIELSAKSEEMNGRATVVITVRDNGAGIAAVQLARVFEPFFTTRKNGTGLGLPNAKKIVEAHGGTIQIQSEMERGTEVILRLPQGERA